MNLEKIMIVSKKFINISKINGSKYVPIFI